MPTPRKFRSAKICAFRGTRLRRKALIQKGDALHAAHLDALAAAHVEAVSGRERAKREREPAAEILSRRRRNSFPVSIRRPGGAFVSAACNAGLPRTHADGRGLGRRSLPRITQMDAERPNRPQASPSLSPTKDVHVGNGVTPQAQSEPRQGRNRIEPTASAVGNRGKEPLPRCRRARAQR